MVLEWGFAVSTTIELNQIKTIVNVSNLSASWLFQRANSEKKQFNVSPDFITEFLDINFKSMQVRLYLNAEAKTFLPCFMHIFVLSLPNELVFLSSCIEAGGDPVLRSFL